MKPRKLSPKQKLFIKEYLVDKNATRAAIAAGYKEKAAYKTGSENLIKPLIKEKIDEGLAAEIAKVEKRLAKNGITKERWLRELALIAFADMDEFVASDQEGNFSAIATIDRKKGRGRAIKKLTQSKSQFGGATSIELHPKLPALGLIADHFGWVKKKVEHSGDSESPIQISEAIDPEILKDPEALEALCVLAEKSNARKLADKT